jgi:hypothetical protein
MKHVKLARIPLKGHPILNEKWIQDQIAEDPLLLGLGDLVLKDRERPQIGAGRLDLLLQDTETNRRYEVEIQLGKTDESHIIRTLEYWDVERRRYPQYDHCAVIVAEDITSRFLNVINLFNGSIPLIAIQMTALQVNDGVSLQFTKVLDEVTLGLVDEDEELQTTDRGYWEEKGTKATVAIADTILELIHSFAPRLQLKYNKFYIGLAVDGQPNNFVIFRPKKNFIRLEIRIPQSTDLEARVEAAGLTLMDYDKRWGRLRIQLTESDAKKNKEFLMELLHEASANAEYQ